MTYGRGQLAHLAQSLNGAVVSHSAELVWGGLRPAVKAPSSALRAPSPQGEKGLSQPDLGRTQ